jgi:hypothetical protein
MFPTFMPYFPMNIFNIPLARGPFSDAVRCPVCKNLIELDKWEDV